MGALRELHRRLKPLFGPLVGILVVVYFAYHAVQGDRGLLNWWRLQQEITEARPVLAALKEDAQRWEHRVSLLRRDRLDLDMLDEVARTTLNMARDDERIILLRSRPQVADVTPPPPTTPPSATVTAAAAPAPRQE